MSKKEKIHRDKKETQGKILVFMISALIGGVIGVLSAMTDTSATVEEGNGLVDTILFGVAVILIMYLQIIIHELGHLLFGIASGYQFTSFRIGSLMWIKQDGSIRLKRYSLMGTGGQCLLEPPVIEDGDMPYRLYLGGGVLMNLISALVAGILFVFFQDTNWLRQILIIFMGTGVLLALMNGIPIPVGPINNDAVQILYYGKEKKALMGLWLELKMNALSASGVRLQDMPDEWFWMPAEEMLEQSATPVTNVYACNRVMEQMNFDLQAKMARHLLTVDAEMVPIHRYILCCDLIFSELVDECRQEELDQLRTKEYCGFERRMRNFPSLIRTQYAYELLVNHDMTAAEKKLQLFEKVAKRYPYKIEIESEQKIMAYARSVYDRRK